MTGVVGGALDDDELDARLSRVTTDGRNETERYAKGGYGLGFAHHGERDPGGWALWEDGSRFGVVHGAVTNLPELSVTAADVVPAVLDRPTEVLPTLEGSFLVAAVDADADRVVLAQDKIGTRNCFYASDGGFGFATRPAPLLSRLDDPRVDEQTVSDVLLLGHAWGDRTLVEGVRSLRPATCLVAEDGAVTTRRYWKPDYGMAEPGEAYLRELNARFRTAVERVGTTLAGEVGLWLSGGIDSRLTAAELQRVADRTGAFDLRTFTYDGNPPGKNLGPARAVAAALGVDNELVALDADTVAGAIPTVVDVTGGMLQWHTAKNLTAAFNVRDPPGVLMEGLEGTLVGHHLARHHLTDVGSAVESMYRSEAVNDRETVASVLTADVDPLDSFREEVRHSDEPTRLGTILDAHFQNYYARMAHASNAVPRERVGTRVPYADGEFLEHVARLPLRYRMGSVPFTGDRIPHGVTRPKFRMLRGLAPDLARIRYERTGLPPTYPFPLQVAGFVGKTAVDRLRSHATYGGRGLADDWYRTNDALRERVDDLLDAACERPLFDGDTIRDLQRAHLRGDGEHLGVIAPVTTLEQWLRRSYDPVVARSRTPA